MKINKIIIAVSLLYFGTGALNAQNPDKDPRETLTFGIKAGGNYSNVWDEQGQDFEADSKLGFAGGFFLGIPFGKSLGFQPEILLSQKGFKGAGTLLGFPYSFSRTTTYIDLPLQIQIKPSKFFTFLAGPQYSYLMSEKNVYTWGSNSTEQQEEFTNENVRKNVLGFVAGADINISHVVVSGRIGWDFQTNHGDGTSSTPRYKNQWLQLTVGFKI
ncbi:MAG TPA: porin family protein [Flavobacteriales bacterium]|nr:porin family protein [Flavobacteriales bacterium]